MKDAWIIYYSSEWSTSYSVAPVKVAYRRGPHVRVVLGGGERRWVLPCCVFSTSAEAFRASLPDWCRAGI